MNDNYCFNPPQTFGVLVPGNFRCYSDGFDRPSFERYFDRNWAVERPPLSFPCIVCEGVANQFTFGRSWELTFRDLLVGEARLIHSIADLAAGQARRVLTSSAGSLMITGFCQHNVCYKVYVAFPAKPASWPRTVPELLVVAYTHSGQALVLRAVWPPRQKNAAVEHCRIYVNSIQNQQPGQPKILWQTGGAEYTRNSALIAPEPLRAQMRAEITRVWANPIVQQKPEFKELPAGADPIPAGADPIPAQN